MAGEVVPLKKPSASADRETKDKERLLKWRNDIADKVIQAVRDDAALHFLDDVDDEEASALDLKAEFNPIINEKTGACDRPNSRGNCNFLSGTTPRMRWRGR